MPYRGPGIRLRDPREGRPDISEQLASAIDVYRRTKEEDRLRDQDVEDRARRQELEDFYLRRDVEADPRYTTDRPQDVPTRRPDVGRDIITGQRDRPGMAGERIEGVPDIFQRARPSIDPGFSRAGPEFTGDPGFSRQAPDLTGDSGFSRDPSDLASMLEAAAPPATEDEQRPRFLPGQFVRGVGYTERPIFDAPPQLRSRVTDMLQPEPVEPFARVRGMDVFRDPEFRTPEQQEERTYRTGREREEEELGDLLDVVGRARGGDEAALDRLLALDPELHEGVMGGDAGYRARLADLSRRGLSDVEAEPVARSESAYSQYLADERDTATAGTSRTIQDLIARRQVIIDALGAVDAVNRFRMNEQFSLEGADYERDVAAALRPFGYSSLDELQADARGLRTLSEQGVDVDADVEAGGETMAPDQQALWDAMLDNIGGRGAGPPVAEGLPGVDTVPLDTAGGGGGALQPATPAVEDSARAFVREQGWDPTTARENLRRAGFGLDEIERILGGG
jgi:hypothetical protein